MSLFPAFCHITSSHGNCCYGYRKIVFAVYKNIHLWGKIKSLTLKSDSDIHHSDFHNITLHHITQDLLLSASVLNMSIGIVVQNCQIFT